MSQWFTSLAHEFQGNPYLQGVTAVVFSFFLEDPTTVGSGLLISEGRMSFAAALIGLTIGVACADFGLYCIGRFASRFAKRFSLIKGSTLITSKRWYERNIFSAIIVPRFIPGTRGPAYITAGILKVSPLKFIAIDGCAIIVWVTLLLSLTVKFGETVFHRIGNYRWHAGIVLILLIVLINLVMARRAKYKTEEIS